MLNTLNPISFDPNSFTQFGLINSLRTGNIIIDMLICLLIPALFSLFRNGTTKIQPLFQNLFNYFRDRGIGEHYRQVDCVQNSTTTGTVSPFNANTDDQTLILQRALSSYISEVCGFVHNNGLVSLVNPRGNYNLAHNVAPQRSAEDRDNTISAQIKGYRLMTVPPYNTWVELSGEGAGVYFKHTKVGDSGEKEGQPQNASNGPKTVKSTYQFYTRGFKSKDKIDVFFQRALGWYQKYLESQETDSRFMYSLDSKANGKMLYKKYTLGDQKTFRSMFFPEKERLLYLLDQFEMKTGKYAIEGYPHKMGLLLHGPPGTGKTSLIKALAHHTKRHIVYINLSKIRTNQDLYSIFFDQTFYTAQQQNIGIRYKFSQLIFVMEDVDCASDVVYRRTSSEETKTTKGEPAIVKNAPLSPRLNLQLEELDTDSLTLSGLLNVIDGIVESPDRILIMTTNHPEKLDPALIRPGRINLQLNLGYMTLNSMIEMFAHYFGKNAVENQANIESLERIYDGSKRGFTPAEIEQLCAQYDRFEDLLPALDKIALVSRSEATFDSFYGERLDSRRPEKIPDPPSGSENSSDLVPALVSRSEATLDSFYGKSLDSRRPEKIPDPSSGSENSSDLVLDEKSEGNKSQSLRKERKSDVQGERECVKKMNPALVRHMRLGMSFINAR